MSTVRGRQAFDALKSVRAFYAEISRLIGTVDHWLDAEVGWKPNANNVLRNMSGQLGKSERWFPEAVDRWYTTGDPYVAAYLSVILLPCNPEWPVEEPLITTGWVRAVKPAEYNWPPRWVSYVAAWTESPRDGTFHPVGLGAAPDKFGRQEQRFSSRPLFELQNSDDLVEQVLRPLVIEVPGSTKSQTDPGDDEADNGVLDANNDGLEA